MKRFLFCIIALLSYAAPAAAFETPATKPAEREILATAGKTFQPMADRFGCTDFAWGNITPQIMTLEYVPAGADVKAWKRLVTVTIYSLPSDPEKNSGYLRALMANLLKNHKSNGTILGTEFYENEKKDPAMFVEYTVGEGPLKEHNAGIFARTGAVTAAFIQVQARESELTAEDLQTVKNILTTKK